MGGAGGLLLPMGVAQPSEPLKTYNAPLWPQPACLPWSLPPATSPPLPGLERRSEYHTQRADQEGSNSAPARLSDRTDMPTSLPTLEEEV